MCVLSPRSVILVVGCHHVLDALVINELCLITCFDHGGGDLALCLVAKLYILCKSSCMSKVHAEFDDLHVAVEGIN